MKCAPMCCIKKVELNVSIRFLTVPVAGQPEGLPLGEDDGHGQVLEGGHVEQRGVLVVTDVLVVVGPRGHVGPVRRPPGARRDVTGT